MEVLLNILVCAAFFGIMEFMAWFSHKYIMHGFLWVLHEDHHQVKPGFFEKNDAFFIMYAIPSSLLMIFGSLNGFDWRFFAGLGILLYGICYFLVHDVLIHRRFKWFDKTDNVYFRAIRKAHKVHHKHLGKHEGECFGMLVVPSKYFKAARKANKAKAA